MERGIFLWQRKDWHDNFQRRLGRDIGPWWQWRSQWFGYPRVLSTPVSKSLVIWVSPVGIPKTLTGNKMRLVLAYCGRNHCLKKSIKFLSVVNMMPDMTWKALKNCSSVKERFSLIWSVSKERSINSSWCRFMPQWQRSLNDNFKKYILKNVMAL